MDLIFNKVSEELIPYIIEQNPPQEFKWHYKTGLILLAVYNAGVFFKKPKYIEWVKSVADYLILEDGSIRTYNKEDYNLDQINTGKILFDVYALTGEKKYRKAIQLLREQLKNQPRTDSMGFWHKSVYPWQIWQDSVYMLSPFYARYAMEFGTAEDFEDSINQILIMASKTRDYKTGLLYHAWDESRKQLWANQNTGCSPHFLCKGMGLFCMAVVDVLDFVPNDEQYKPYREYLIQTINSLVAAILAVQDEKTGMWYQIMDQATRERNYLETAGSSMLTYFMLKSLRLDYIKSSLVEDTMIAANKAYFGICQNMLTKDEENHFHLHGITGLSGLGGNPYRDGSFDYYVKDPLRTDDFRGLGPFIMASTEFEMKLEK